MSKKSNRSRWITQHVRKNNVSYSEAKQKAIIEFGEPINTHVIGTNNIKRFKVDVKQFHKLRKLNKHNKT
jgi:hypothetical protein